MALRTPSVFVSTSNEFDNLARYVHHIELNHQQQQQQLPSASSAIEVQYCRSDTVEFAKQLKPDNDLF